MKNKRHAFKTVGVNYTYRGETVKILEDGVYTLDGVKILKPDAPFTGALAPTTRIRIEALIDLFFADAKSKPS